MCNPTILLDKIVEKIVDIAFESVGRHLGYLFHYKQNMKNLEVEMNKLQERRETVEGHIDEAKASGEVILDDVSDWLNGADWQRQEIETFMDEKTVKENVQCFKFSCPDFISRYRLSKEAEKKMGDVKSLTQKANFDTISRPAPPTLELQFPSSGEYVSFDSRASAFNMIMEALKDSKVNVIGVYGAGGVGKTTMAERVGEQVMKAGLFHEVVMVVVSHDAKVFKIQGMLANCLNLKLEGHTEVRRADILWNRLNNGKRNLVILDDIWKELNLKEIGIPITDGNKGCKVVLTSRNQDVLKNMRVDKDFPIHVLSDQEAWNLFKEKTGNYVESHDQLHDIAYMVCKECRGLPVAIVAVGAALKDKSMFAWKSSLDKLKKSLLNKIEAIDTKLFVSLRLSYDYLESTDAKSCFLLCCLFPEDAQIPIEELARHCMARRLLDQNPNTLEEARDIVCSVVNTLKTSCLLLDGKNNDFVKMHDIVRDVAISIAKEEKAFLVKHGVKKWPETGTYEKYSAISLSSETIHELPDELVCPELHTLILECSSSKFQPELNKEISDGFFRGTEKLMILELNKVTLLPLPSSLGKLKELRMLCLIDCKLGDIAILKYLKNKLEVLRLRGCDIKVLPPEVGELTRLRLLDLGDCDELKVIPHGVISKLFLLEELHLPRSFENWEGTTGNDEISQVSLDELMSLTRLSTLAIHIPNHWLLPKDLGFQNLIRFNITVGDLCHLSSYLYSDDNYSLVVLRGLYIDDDFNILECLLGKPGRGGLYPSRSFNNLTQLEIRDCRLKALFSPSCARGLLQLQRLVIDGSEIMEAVIGNEGEKDEEIIANVIYFSQLKTLKLHGLPRLISFYPRIKKATKIESHSFAPAQSLFNEKVILPDLEVLEVDRLGNIVQIWDKQFPWVNKNTMSCSKLRDVEVQRCKKLMNLVPSNILPQLQNLQKLCVEGCPNIESIVFKEEEEAADDSSMIIPKLWYLRISDMENLKSFYSSSTASNALSLFNHQVILPDLEALEVDRLGNIVQIWDKQFPWVNENTTSCGKLRDVKVQHCEKLTNLVPSNILPQLQNLQKLCVEGCPKIESVVFKNEKEGAADDDSTMIICLLQYLRISDMENLKSFYFSSTASNAQSLFNHQVILPFLEFLEVDKLGNIVEIWDKQSPSVNENTVSCGKLRDVKVQRCEKLMNLIPSNILPRLDKLKKLCIEGCPKIESVVFKNKKEGAVADDSTVIITQLQYLRISDMEKLKSFYSSSRASDAHFLFNHQVILPDLEALEVDRLGNIVQIWDKQFPWVNENTVSCGKLRDVKVQHCEKLTNLVPSNILPRLQNLQKLCVEGCPKIESVVFKNEKEGAVADDSTMIIPQLQYLRISDMEKLKSFYSSSRASNAQSLFNHQVILPVLEVFEVDRLGNIVEIWDKQSPWLNQNTVSSFKLRDMKIQQCKTLMNLVPSIILPRLQHLQNLCVEGCPNIESIFFENEKEEEVADDSALIIPQLRYLRISDMEKLKSFYSSSRASNAQSLFNHQVILPFLEVFEMDRLGNIVEIWDKQSPWLNQNTVSSFKLRDMKVQQCKTLMNLVPSNILPRLQHLQNLCVEGCPNIESIVFENEKEEEAADASSLIIPQLRYLRISDMENLKSFYSSSGASNVQSLFNHQVSLPNLEVLHVSDLENLERLGHGPLSAGSLSKLKEFSVRCCGNLLCIFPSQFLPMLRELQELTIESCHSLDVVFQLEGLVLSNILPNLQKLCVEGCPKIESVVFKNEKEEVADDRTLIIPQLRYLRISDMDNLKSFYSSFTASNAHSLFNHQVTFPRLKILELEGCASLRNIFHPYMVKVLENLGELIINDCSKMESVIDKEEEVQGGQQRKTDKTLFHFHRLSKLELRRLPELRTFCHFTRPLELPLLSEMVICDCPIMDSFSSGHVSTPNLSLKGVSLYPKERLRW